MTAQNYYIGANSWNEIIGSWEQRVKEADELHPPQRVKADRVTALMCEAKIPWEIVEQGREREFVEEYHKFLCDTFGKENVHGECVHVDETHLYITVEMEVKKYIDDHGLDNRIMRELSKQYPNFENKVAEIKEELKQEIHYHMSR